MAVPDIRYFSHPDDLKGASPENLARLLLPYTDFLESRGLNIAKSGIEVSSLDYATLANILMTPDPSMPCELIDSLHYIREMAAPEAMDYLLSEAGIYGIPIDDLELSPADLAVQIWLYDRSILERGYAERCLIRPCTFVYFQERDSQCAEFRGLSPSIIRALEGDLDVWFQRSKRGRGCRVHVSTRQDGIWFLIWHGAPLRREGCIEHGKSSCICYRPERYDVLIYHPATHELQIDAGTREEREVYRRLFGRHFFGDDHHFPGTAIYTLEPLRTDGERALVCSDVDGMELVTLRRIEFVIGRSIRSTESIEANDVFAAINAGNVGIPRSCRLREAGFSIRFSDSKAPRTVSLRPSNMVCYQRDSDCDMVEWWLRLRGFALRTHLVFAFLTGFLRRWVLEVDGILSYLPESVFVV
jgi:hypothetical protein